ncbi:hypothetical protein PSPO01_10207 [Paraphaeosphaeria sporulosa]
MPGPRLAHPLHELAPNGPRRGCPCSSRRDVNSAPSTLAQIQRHARERAFTLPPTAAAVSGSVSSHCATARTGLVILPLPVARPAATATVLPWSWSPMPAGLGLYGLWQSAHRGFAKSRTNCEQLPWHTPHVRDATTSPSAGVPVQGVACIA